MQDPQDDVPPRPVPPQDLFGHLFAAIRFSAQGVPRLWQEPAFRLQVLAAALALPLLVAGHAVALQYVLFLILFLFVAALEAINTAIEEITDRLSPEYSNMARNAKDLGSLAVACGSLAEIVIVLWVLVT